ncbi:unnamed protein product [Musa hybrid cultivar]
MENARPPSPRSPLLLRSRSGACGLTRRPASPSRQSVPLFSSFSNSAPAALTRSHSAAKHRPQVTDPSATSCCLSKENRKSISCGLPPPDPPASLRKPRTAPSAWALSPGRSPPRSTSAPAQRDARKTKTGFSAWARSPSQSKPSPDPSRAAPVVTAGGKKGGGGGVLGLFRRRKEAAPGEEESHQLRLLTSRLIQWRFANARAVAAVEAARCNAEEKLFYAWLRIYELRNLVAAKRILVQRRKQKMKLPQILRPQLRLLSQWEPHAKKHVEAVATLVRLLGAAAFSLPLVEGAEANSVSLRRCLSSSMEAMTDIAATAGVFYAKVGDIDTMLYELVETIRLEIQGLEELMEMCTSVTSLEMHEVSLRAHMIQAIHCALNHTLNLKSLPLWAALLVIKPRWEHKPRWSPSSLLDQVRIMSGVEAPLRPKRKKVLVDYLVQFRWIVVVFVVLPVSCFIYFRLFLGHVRSAMKSDERRRKEHEENVLKVIKRLKQRDPTKDGLVCTARKPYIAVGMRNVDYKRARHFEVDLSAFRNILEIDKERMIAKVEPLVNMGQITRATIPMNLSLAVVAELDDLTVGGLINGYGIEGSSHLYGLFSDTVVAMEVVLADGRLVRCTRDNDHSDLFYGIPWSQGTLGLMVSAEIKLIHVREYMKVTYTPHRGTLKELAQDYADSFAPRDGDSSRVPDFVETMIYNPTEAVCMTGKYASEAEAKKKGNVINSIGWWFKPWFYQHAQTALQRGEFVEYIPTREYYHRHTRSLYWEGKLILPCADQWWFRWFLGWLMPPKVSLLKATQGEAIRNYYHDMHVIQDLLIPLYKVADALEFCHRETELYPVWLCPHRLFKLPLKTMVHPETGFEDHHRQGDTSFAQMFTDVGLYYAPGPVFRGEEFDGAEVVRALEEWMIQNHGFQAQYSVSELTEKNFWRMFDASHYEHCRRKYGAIGTFMNVYYKSKKGKKTEKEVQDAEAEAAIVEADHAEEE